MGMFVQFHRVEEIRLTDVVHFPAVGGNEQTFWTRQLKIRFDDHTSVSFNLFSYIEGGLGVHCSELVETVQQSLNDVMSDGRLDTELYPADNPDKTSP
jgi:hypothetical protein